MYEDGHVWFVFYGMVSYGMYVCTCACMQGMQARMHASMRACLHVHARVDENPKRDPWTSPDRPTGEVVEAAGMILRHMGVLQGIRGFWV